MQISLFQRYKAFVNSHAIGETYTTDQLFENVGRWESETWWKRITKQRMYRTSTYQTYLHRLGAVQNVKRGLWKVLHHVPEWFYSKHMNYLLGYERNEWSLDYMLDQGFPRELAERVHIPKHERQNPFKSTSLQTMSSPSKAINSIIKSESQPTTMHNSATVTSNSETVSIDVKLLKKLYDGASQEMKDRLMIKYAPHLEEYYSFGDSLELSVSQFSGPLMIANGLAPTFHERKCLVVSPEYELCSKETRGFTFLYFVKK